MNIDEEDHTEMADNDIQNEDLELETPLASPDIDKKEEQDNPNTNDYLDQNSSPNKIIDNDDDQETKSENLGQELISDENSVLNTGEIIDTESTKNETELKEIETDLIESNNNGQEPNDAQAVKKVHFASEENNKETSENKDELKPSVDELVEKAKEEDHEEEDEDYPDDYFVIHQNQRRPKNVCKVW